MWGEIKDATMLKKNKAVEGAFIAYSGVFHEGEQLEKPIQVSKSVKKGYVVDVFSWIARDEKIQSENEEEKKKDEEDRIRCEYQSMLREEVREEEKRQKEAKK